MRKLWLSVSVAMVVAAILACPSSSEAQKGKGGGKGGRLFPAPGNGKGEPGRPFDHPNSGNNLPQSTRDKLPPGLRDNPENHPGTANHLRKLDDAKSGDSLNPLNSNRPFAQPNSGNSLPKEIRDKLPPGLRDMPDNHPGLANHLRKMGVLKDYPQIDPVPPQVRNQLPLGLRDQPYDNPAVANYLGKLGYTIGQDGALIPPPAVAPPTPILPQSFQPFGGLLRRR